MSPTRRRGAKAMPCKLKKAIRSVSMLSICYDLSAKARWSSFASRIWLGGSYTSIAALYLVSRPCFKAVHQMHVSGCRNSDEPDKPDELEIDIQHDNANIIMLTRMDREVE